MKKMLAKAVVLGLVLGGIGFVANDAQAADIGNGVKIEVNKVTGIVYAEHGLQTSLATQANLAKVDEVAEKAKTAATENATNIATNKDAITANQNAINKEITDREAADNALEQKITDEAKAREDADNALEQKITDEAKVREDADNALEQKITDEAKVREDADEKLGGRIDAEAAERKAEVARLDGRINQLDARVEKVGAMAAAIANLHTMGYDPEAPTEIAVGVGQYRDKTGMALGAFHYPNRDFMLSFSVSTAGDEFMGGIGATWKFGRKSPEELRQAEAEKAAKAKLAKAEAAKKAAKDARVAAQQKRHAEMLAARTAK